MERRPTAIFAVDMVGYSRPMEDVLTSNAEFPLVHKMLVLSTQSLAKP